MATRALQVVITGDTSSFKRSMGQIDSTVDHTQGRLSKFGKIGAAAFAGVGIAAAAGAAVGIKKVADAAIESEKSQSKMVTQLKAANVSYRAHAAEIDRVIQKHSQLSGLDDEDLQDAFTNIVRVTGDVSKSLRLTGLAADFARAKHIDVAKAGELVGKVAGGNTGILSRYGITLKQGATASEALATLQGKFAGQAEAYGKTTAGSLDRASVASENLQEIVGAKLTPLLAKAATAFVNLVDKSGKLAGPIRTATGTIRDAYDSIVKAVRRFADHNRESIDDVVRAFRNVAKFARAVFEDVVIPILKRVAPIARDLAEGVLRHIGGMIRLVSALINGDWSKAWDAFKDIIRNARDTLGRVMHGIWVLIKDGLEEIPGLALDASKAIGKAIYDGIRSGLKNAAKGNGLAGTIGGLLPGVGPIFKAAQGLGDGIGKAMPGTAGLLGGGAFGGDLHGAQPGMRPFAQVASRYGLQVSSGRNDHSKYTSSGHLSYHGTGEALDFSNGTNTPQEMAFARYMVSNFGSRIAELIYTPLGYSIKDGRRVPPIDAAAHYNHVHVAYDLGRPGIGDGIGKTAKAAKAAGFRGEALVRAVAIAGAESRYDDDAQNLQYPDHSIGLWQINQLAHHGRYGSDRALTNPMVNARAAWEVSGHGRNFGPWSTWPSAARGYMSRARAAVAALSSGGAPSAGGGGRGSAGKTKPGGSGLPGIPTGKVKPGGRGIPTPATNGLGDAPSGTDYIDALIAEAALTSGTGDDIAAQKQAVAYWRQQRATAGSDPRTRAAAATGLKGALDQLEALTGALETANRIAEQDRTSRAEVIANQRELLRLARTQPAAIFGALAAAMDASIGGRVGLGYQSVGYAGNVAAY